MLEKARGLPTIFLGLFLGSALSFSGCGGEEGVDGAEELALTETSAETMAVAEALNTILELEEVTGNMLGMLDSSSQSVLTPQAQVPTGGCPQISTNTEVSFSELPTAPAGVTTEVIIDYGEEGCQEVPGGLVRKGSISILVEVQGPSSQLISIEFNNFVNGDKTLNGSITIQNTIDSSQRIVQSRSINVTLTLPDKTLGVTVAESTVVVTGDEIIIEKESGRIDDSELGRVDFALNNVVLDPNCPYPVEGTITIEKSGLTATVNFSEASCEGTVTAVINGVEVTLEL